jgi:hypothetical protein
MNPLGRLRGPEETPEFLVRVSGVRKPVGFRPGELTRRSTRETGAEKDRGNIKQGMRLAGIGAGGLR